MKWVRIAGILVVLFLLLGSGVFWLFHTTEGVHFLLSTIARVTSGSARAETIKGSLAGGLSLSGFTMTLSGTTVSASRIELLCRPSGLLGGRLDVQMLSGEDVEIVRWGPEDKGPVEFIPPRVPRWVAAFDGRIKDFRVKGLRYGRPRQEPVLLQSVTGQAEWHRGQLAVTRLDLLSPAGQASGNLRIGFYRPLLQMEMWIYSRENHFGLDTFFVRTALKPAITLTAMSGRINAWGYKESDNLVSFGADVSASRYTLKVGDLALDRRGDHKGRIAARGRITTGKKETFFKAEAEMADFGLQGLVPLPLTFTGKAGVEGTTDRYTGRFALFSRQKDWRKFTLDGLFQGNSDRVATTLAGGWLDGKIEGSSSVDWKGDLTIAGDVTVKGLDTARVDPTWPGSINGRAGFRLSRPPSGDMTAAVDLRLTESTFRQRPITGTLDAVYGNRTLRVKELVLQGKGFDVNARGILNERIDFQATVTDLASLMPGSRGAAGGKGWVRYAGNDAFALDFSGRATGVRYQGAGVGTLAVSAGIDRAKRDDISLNVAGDSLTYGSFDIRSFRADVQGRVSSHEAHVRIAGPDTRAEIAFSGGYGKSTWRGTLKGVSGRDGKRGVWRLESPAEIEISTKRFYLEPLLLEGKGGESLGFAADLRLKPTEGFVKGEWQNVDLARLEPVLPVSLLLRDTGRLYLAWNDGALTEISGQAASGKGEVRYKGTVFYLSRSRLELSWTKRGLTGGGQALLTDGAALTVDFSSPSRPVFGIPERGNFSTVLQAFHLPLLNPFFAKGMSIDGTASARIEGRFLPASAFAVDRFDVRVLQGLLIKAEPNGVTQVAFPSALAQGEWKDRGLRGRIALDAGKTGSIRGEAIMPVPARLPLKTVSTGPVFLDMRVQVRDMGSLAPLFPEAIQGPGGRMEAAVSASGTWERPGLNASLALRDAGAFISGPDLRIRGGQADGRLIWTRGQGLTATLDARLDGETGGGFLQADVQSTAGPRMGLPDTANVKVRVNNLNMGLVKPLLPDPLVITGQVVGSLEGVLLPGKQVRAAFDAHLRDGAFVWKMDRGQARGDIRNAGLKGSWDSEGLSGRVNLEMARRGRLEGSFFLPVPGRLPARPVPAGPVDVKVAGQVEEDGLMSALFPGLVQETKGSLAVNARVNGIWARPVYSGNASLSDAGASLPTAGIRIEAIRAKAVFSEQRMDIQEFHATSGPGQIEGSGTVSFKKGGLDTYAGKLAGNRFQAVYLPDLRLLVSPSLTIKGTGKALAVDGEILVPRLHVYGPPTENVVRPSADVVVVGGKDKRKKEALPLDLQARVRVVLGDDVRIRMRGIDARLDGAVALTVKGPDEMSGTGEIRIAEGKYSAYGVDLQITRGRITFAGPLERGRLDILAVRKIEGAGGTFQTRDGLLGAAADKTGKTPAFQTLTGTGFRETQTAGVQIGGIVQRPRIDLYSNPPLSDSDTLSYMILGHPVSGDAAQASLLFRTAGSFLGGKTGGSVQDQLKKMLGLETLDIGTETVATQEGQAEQTIVRVGRYLAPNLYISLGRSLFTNEYVVTARYSLSRNWEIQTRTGDRTGGDIYYKVQFD